MPPVFRRKRTEGRQTMKKKLIMMLTVLLAAAAITVAVPAAAEVPADLNTDASAIIDALTIADYTSVSKIPMAVDFTVSVEFDDEGKPNVVTDYPFEAADATEMELEYIKEGINIELHYDAVRSETRFGNYYNGQKYAEVNEEVVEMVRNGEMTLESVRIKKPCNNGQTGWYLTYSISSKCYMEYIEVTESTGHQATDTYTETRYIYYHNGKISSSQYSKNMDKAYLQIKYDPYGARQSAIIVELWPGNKMYSYDEYTGLIGGKKISELDLGFDETDLQVKAPAALNDDTSAATETLSIDKYTSVSKIPMAVDFTVSMEFDNAGRPYIVTDYPFDATGATEMNLTYSKGDIHSVITVKYEHRTGTVETTSFNSEVFPHYDFSDVWEMIRNGELTLDDTVVVNTSFFSSRADWFLYYSISQKQYVKYEETTFVMAYGWVNAGGVEKRLYYSDGKLNGSYYLKRTDKADLQLLYDAYGTLRHAAISEHQTEFKTYSYDKSTGLFDGKKISELNLGFEEADMQVKAPAALETEQGEH